MSVIGTPVESTPGGVTSTTLSIVVPTGGGVIYVHADGTANATSVSSSINGAFTSLQTPGQIGVSGLFPTLWGINASAGTHTVTISSTTANSIYYTMGLSVSQATLNLSNSAQSSSAGTGTNLLTSGSISPTTADIVFGLFIAVSAGAIATAGTSPNAFTAISLTLGNPNKNFLEYFQMSASGTINPTAGSTVNGYYQGFTFSCTPTYATSAGSSAGTGSVSAVSNAIASGGAQTAGVSNPVIQALATIKAVVLAQGTAHAPVRSAISSVGAVGSMTGVGFAFSGVQGAALSQGVATVNVVPGYQASAAAASSSGVSTVRMQTPDVVVMGATAVTQGAAAAAAGVAAVTCVGATGGSPILVPAAASAIAAAVVNGSAVQFGGVVTAAAYSAGAAYVTPRSPVTPTPVLAIKRDGRLRREITDEQMEQDQRDIQDLMPLLVAHIAKYEERPR